jgi:rare lipoprotein A
MRRNVLLGAAALLFSGAALPGAALAATDGFANGSLAIREQHVGPRPASEPPLGPSLPPVVIASATPVKVSQGTASWYGPGFYGNRTASGEVLRPGTLTAAHRSLPFGTRVRVTNLHNGRSAVVRINDRGPFHGSRVIDLAHGAASELGVTASGLAPVRLEVLR